MYPVKNTFVDELAADITTSSQTIHVTQAHRFPDPPNYATIGVQNDAEVVFYAGIDVANNTLTGCLRGQSGTVPGTWEAGTEVYHAWTAANANNMLQNVIENTNGLASVPAQIDNAVQKSYQQFTTGSSILSAGGWTQTPDNRFSQTISVAGVTAAMDANVTVNDEDWEKISMNGSRVACVDGGVVVITAEEPAEDVGVSYEVWRVV